MVQIAIHRIWALALVLTGACAGIAGAACNQFQDLVDVIVLSDSLRDVDPQQGAAMIAMADRASDLDPDQLSRALAARGLDQAGRDVFQLRDTMYVMAQKARMGQVHAAQRYAVSPSFRNVLSNLSQGLAEACPELRLNPSAFGAPAQIQIDAEGPSERVWKGSDFAPRRKSDPDELAGVEKSTEARDSVLWAFGIWVTSIVLLLLAHLALRVRDLWRARAVLGHLACEVRFSVIGIDGRLARVGPREARFTAAEPVGAELLRALQPGDLATVTLAGEVRAIRCEAVTQTDTVLAFIPPLDLAELAALREQSTTVPAPFIARLAREMVATFGGCRPHRPVWPVLRPRRRLP